MSIPLKTCTKCKANVPVHFEECPFDGSPLKLSNTGGSDGPQLPDKFEIKSVIGRGGMSTVYKAVQKPMDRTVAIKVMKQHLADDPVATARFEREARAVAALRHPNIIAVFDFGMTPQREMYLVMDWAEGTTLEDIITNEGHLTPPRAVPFFRQIASALAHAHERHVIHRDLKPQNICVAKTDHGNETALIVDFGLAKFVNPDQPDTNITRAGLTCGSPQYMSPEQVQAIPLDGRSDIYSLGCLMYEVLSGNPPFVGDTTFDTMNKHVKEPIPGFASILQIPQSIEHVVKKCMAKRLEDRYQTADEILKDLPAADQ